MDTKQELEKAREELAEGLDAKLHGLPEWRAFRAIDRALMAMRGEEEPPKPTAKIHARKTGAAVELPGGGTVRVHPTYTKLTALALEDKGEPITTPELMRYIGNNRPLHSDAEKAKINVTSSLSKDSRFQSVPWENGRAWWWADREVPRKGQTGLDLADP